MSGQYEGKVALVIGASRGAGGKREAFQDGLKGVPGKGGWWFKFGGVFCVSYEGGNLYGHPKRN